MQSKYKEGSGSWYRHKCNIQPLPGYPWNGIFSSFEELKEYFNKDRLTCLLCGRNYGNLGIHISQGHGTTMDEYRQQFGIPWTYGLAGKIFRDKSSKHITALRETGKVPYSPSPGHIKKIIKLSQERRPLVEASRNDSRHKLLKLHGRKEKWTQEDYEEYLRRIASGRTPAEVSHDKDMPRRQTFLKYVAVNEKFKKKYEKIWRNLPYSVQVRASKLDKKFERDLIKLRRKGNTLLKIAAALGVTVSAVRQRWHTLKKQGKLTPDDLKLESKRRTLADYEEYLKRIQSGRSVTAVGNDRDMPTYRSFHYYLKKNATFKKRYEKIRKTLSSMSL